MRHALGVAAACLALTAGAQAAERPLAGASLAFRHDGLSLGSGVRSVLRTELPRIDPERLDIVSLPPPASPGLLDRYQRALEGESRRFLAKDAWLLWGAVEDDDGNRPQRLQREAERIFERANGRALSGVLEGMVAASRAMREAREYVEGVRLDLVRGERMGLRAGPTDRGATRAGASIGLVALGDPKLEISGRMARGLRARLEVPLAGDGLRATLSLPLAAGLRCTLGAGHEPSGDGPWVSAGFDLKF